MQGETENQAWTTNCRCGHTSCRPLQIKMFTVCRKASLHGSCTMSCKHCTGRGGGEEACTALVTTTSDPPPVRQLAVNAGGPPKPAKQAGHHCHVHMPCMHVPLQIKMFMTRRKASLIIKRGQLPVGVGIPASDPYTSKTSLTRHKSKSEIQAWTNNCRCGHTSF